MNGTNQYQGSTVQTKKTSWFWVAVMVAALGGLALVYNYSLTPTAPYENTGGANSTPPDSVAEDAVLDQELRDANPESLDTELNSIEQELGK